MTQLIQRTGKKQELLTIHLKNDPSFKEEKEHIWSLYFRFGGIWKTTSQTAQISVVHKYSGHHLQLKDTCQAALNPHIWK